MDGHGTVTQIAQQPEAGTHPSGIGAEDGKRHQPPRFQPRIIRQPFHKRHHVVRVQTELAFLTRRVHLYENIQITLQRIKALVELLSQTDTV